jgi:hypothetical protein
MNLFKKKKPVDDEIDKISTFPEEYDGFYFVPTYEDSEESYQLAFFNFKDEMANSKPIEMSEMGDKFHLAFFTQADDGSPVFNDSFEAILADPIVYVNNLVGTGLSGCICRKTVKSDVWFTEYLDYVTGGEFKLKVKEAFSNLAE